MSKVFLQAEWRKLVMANYSVDPELLREYVPFGTSLDLWNGKCYVSLVGFMFLNTRVKGVKIPWHINFEEVNLRFYVVFEKNGEVRRGVVFIKEIVPRPALTFVANTVYGEHYQTMPMKHQWLDFDGRQTIGYAWKHRQWNHLRINALSTPSVILPGSEEEFITEHYWGYTRLSERRTSEYGVEHPRWDVYKTLDYDIQVEFGTVYGRKFDFLSEQEPDSVFLAEGSEIRVLGGQIIKNHYEHTQ